MACVEVRVPTSERPTILSLANKAEPAEPHEQQSAPMIRPLPRGVIALLS